MKRLLLLLTVIFGATPVVCRAEPQCPWLNAATAGGFLGGDAQAAVTGVTVDGDATCEFSGAANAMLRIAVHTMAHMIDEFPGYLAQCGAGAQALKGIGNQAVECIAKTGESKGQEIIIGRVRDRAFVITIRAAWIGRPPTSPTKTSNPISDNSENIAEMVAGSMF